MVAAGLLALVNSLLGQLEAPLALTVGGLFADVWVIVFIVLLLTFPTGGRLASDADRRLVAIATVPLFFLQLLFMQFHREEGNLLLTFEDQGVADVIDKLQRTSIALLCLTVAVVIGLRFRAASPPRRRALLPSVAGAFSMLLFAALLINDLVSGSRSQALLWIAACSLVSVPAALLFGLLRSRLARAGLGKLLRDLTAMRGPELEAALARAAGDPALRLVSVAADAPAGRSVVPVERDGRPIAAIAYDPSLDDDPDLVDAIRAAAAIAIEKEQLREEAQERLAELRASRERLVAAGDAERRRLERNLHDGAQQRLVALALQLRMIERRIQIDPAAATELVNSASDELASSLSELRELAQGIHPAVLNHGLPAALDSLASRATVPTAVAFDVAGPLPGAVELAAYFVASEALANVGKYASATSATITVRPVAGGAELEIADDGVGGADFARGSGLRGLADRVEALDGHLRVLSPPGEGTVITAEFPTSSGHPPPDSDPDTRRRRVAGVRRAPSERIMLL